MKSITKSIRNLMVFSSIAFFCPNANSESTAKSQVFKLEAVTVTAQKREEYKQEVPISMDAFTDIQIEDARIDSTLDLIRFSPNAHMKYNYYENMVVLRGISTMRASIYTPAAFYMDDVSYPLQFMQNAELYDIERAEVLKGPQGTLYGRNAEAGVVNIITKPPGEEFQGKVFSEYGNYSTFRGGANISGPIAADRLFLGGAFQYKSSDGIVKNESNDDEKSADLKHANGRVSLRWTPEKRWDISLIADVMNADDHCGGHRYINGPRATEPFRHRADSEEFYRQGGNSEALRIKYAGNRFNILSVSSLLANNLEKQNDTDLWDDKTSAKYHTNEFDEQQYSQEIRISSSPNGPFQWMGGVYGFVDETRIKLQIHARIDKHDLYASRIRSGIQGLCHIRPGDLYLSRPAPPDRGNPPGPPGLRRQRQRRGEKQILRSGNGLR